MWVVFHRMLRRCESLPSLDHSSLTSRKTSPLTLGVSRQKSHLLRFGVVSKAGFGRSLRVMRGDRRTKIDCPGERKRLHSIQLPGFSIRGGKGRKLLPLTFDEIGRA